jgi:hypothetical protein
MFLGFLDVICKSGVKIFGSYRTFDGKKLYANIGGGEI